MFRSWANKCSQLYPCPVSMSIDSFVQNICGYCRANDDVQRNTKVSGRLAWRATAATFTCDAVGCRPGFAAFFLFLFEWYHSDCTCLLEGWTTPSVTSLNHGLIFFFAIPELATVHFPRKDTYAPSVIFNFNWPRNCFIFFRGCEALLPKRLISRLFFLPFLMDFFPAH